MPVPVLRQIILDGAGSVPFARPFLRALPFLLLLYLLKRYFQGASNGSERNMHGKVVMVTGGTSGIGEHVVRGLASRGAQIVLLTHAPVTDPFLVQYIEDLRTDTASELITAEQVELDSLHSIRTFATKWIDNAPPRRLDMVILCANVMAPRGGKIESTVEDLEINFAVNYLANFHLLSILSPALRAQPPDRDVRVIMGTCASYLGGELPVGKEGKKTAAAAAASSSFPSSSGPTPTHAFKPSTAYASSKLALMTFAKAFQKHLSAYPRPDKKPMNTRVLMVDPGFTRTPGMMRHLTWGSLTGLSFYLLLYPLWWLVLKSPDMGAQSFLYAAMEERYGRGGGGAGEGAWLIKECREVKVGRAEVGDEGAQKALWEYSEALVLEAEKRGARARKEEKARRERKGRQEGEEVVAAGPGASKAKDAVDVPTAEKQTLTRRSRKA